MSEQKSKKSDAKPNIKKEPSPLKAFDQTMVVVSKEYPYLGKNGAGSIVEKKGAQAGSQYNLETTAG